MKNKLDEILGTVAEIVGVVAIDRSKAWHSSTPAYGVIYVVGLVLAFACLYYGVIIAGRMLRKQ